MVVFLPGKGTRITFHSHHFGREYSRRGPGATAQSATVSLKGDPGGGVVSVHLSRRLWALSTRLSGRMPLASSATLASHPPPGPRPCHRPRQPALSTPDSGLGGLRGHVQLVVFDPFAFLSAQLSNLE